MCENLIRVLRDEIKELKKEKDEWEKLYAITYNEYIKTGLLYVEQLKKSHKYQDELRELNSSSIKHIDVKAEMIKIKKEIRE